MGGRCPDPGGCATVRAVPARDEQRPPFEEEVRARLRALRVARGLSVAAVAAGAGLHPSALSRLESGARRLRLDHLPVLARGLGVEVGALLEDPPTERTLTMPDGKAFVPLAPPAAGALRAARVTLPPATQAEAPALHAHPGHERVYVLAGRLRLLLGEEELVVAPGESVAFDTAVPHWSGAVAEPVELLAVFDPRGEEAQRPAALRRAPDGGRR